MRFPTLYAFQPHPPQAVPLC